MEGGQPGFFGEIIHVFKLRKQSALLFASTWDIIKMPLNSLHALFLTLSWLITLVPSFIARRWVGLQTS